MATNLDSLTVGSKAVLMVLTTVQQTVTWKVVRSASNLAGLLELISVENLGECLAELMACCWAEQKVRKMAGYSAVYLVEK